MHSFSKHLPNAWLYANGYSSFQVALLAKNPPAREGDASLITGLGNPLEEGMATHSSILAWRTPWTGEPGRSEEHTSELQSPTHIRMPSH